MWFRRPRHATEAQAVTFRQCPQCTYDFATGEGERSCHYYECPYLPEALDVRCPTCLYNFSVEDGNPDCGDPPDCEFAREVAPQRLANLAGWLRERERVSDG
jgi:rubredoxin